jgi:hypothetical protein
MCDDGRVDDYTLNVATNDPIFGDQFTMLGWGNLVFHGSGCSNSFGGPVDTGPMAFMFLYLLGDMDASHSAVVTDGLASGWIHAGMNNGQRYSYSQIKLDMEEFFQTMNAVRNNGVQGTYYDTTGHGPGGSSSWLQNMNRLDNLAGAYLNAIPLFAKRALGLCFPNIPQLIIDIDAQIDTGLSASYDNAIYGGLKDNIGAISIGGANPGDMWGNYPVGANRLSYNYEGCKMLVGGAIHFANAFLVQDDNPSNDLFMVGTTRPALDDTCDQQLHSRWHWRATQVMRTLLRMTQLARQTGTVAFHGDQTL